MDGDAAPAQDGLPIRRHGSSCGSENSADVNHPAGTEPAPWMEMLRLPRMACPSVAMAPPAAARIATPARSAKVLIYAAIILIMGFRMVFPARSYGIISYSHGIIASIRSEIACIIG
ncbi:hypothetical protein BS78_01G377800 [Paspalum vaginatum]|nr:hypothetical protein BS78_01G377800 [Paspalum vaginatum]